MVFLLLFGGAMALAFSKLRPIFRERGEINAQVTGRLAETLGGIRVVKAYRMEEKEQRVFGEGVERLFTNVKRSITGTSAITRVCNRHYRRSRRLDDFIRWTGDPFGFDDPGRPDHVRRLRDRFGCAPSFRSPRLGHRSARRLQG